MKQIIVYLLFLFSIFHLSGCSNNSNPETISQILYNLEQNNPNPFSSKTYIRFQIPKISYVQLIIFSKFGEQVTNIIDKELNPGYYEIEWDGSNYPAGNYYYEFKATISATGQIGYYGIKSMTLVK